MPTSADATAAPPNLVLILANPFSGAKSNTRRVERLAGALTRHGLESRVLWTPAERNAALDDPNLPRTCRCLVAAGGDGTTADIFNRRLDVPITLLPLGNENLLARQFGITGRTDRLADLIAAGKTACIDLGQVNQRRFALMASAGLDAAVVARIDRWRKTGAGLRRVRRISYILPTLKTLLEYPCPRLALEADGRRIEGAHALVFNINRYGFNLSFAPDARGDDGLLDYVVFQNPGRLNVLRYLGGVALGIHRKFGDVATGRAARVRIISETPVPLQTDGDVAGTTPAEISVLPACLRVIVP